MLNQSKSAMAWLYLLTAKKGLIRVTEIKIKLGQFDKDEIPNLEELAHYLEKDLTERSVCNSNYKIKFV